MTKKTTLTPIDQADRDVAAVSLDQNVIVSAGAGTGKTTLLIDRLTLLILGKEIPIERIVALTFTKKAAEEMRVRLEARLRMIMNETEPVPLLEEHFPNNREAWPRLARTALEAIPKAQMGTIHSFAAHLLRLYPVQAGVDPNFAEDDGSIQEMVFEEEWSRWLSEELNENAQRGPVWTDILQRVELDDIRELAGRMVSPLVDLTAVRSRTDQSAAASRWVKEATILLNQNPIPARATSFKPFMESVLGVLEAVATGEAVSRADLERLERFHGDLPSSWKKEPALEDKGRKLISFARAIAFVDDALMEQVLDLLVPFVRRVRAELVRQGLVSFEGLLVFARDLLRDHPDVRAEMKKRFATFLIDEFQDTDPLQGEILLYLAEASGKEAREWREVSLGSGRLFVVGDPKQSIYRFRGADMAAYQEITGLMEKDGAIKTTLSANFRSRPHLLQFVNAVFPSIMEEEPYVQPVYTPLDAGREADRAPAVSFSFVTRRGGAGNADEFRRFEADLIAKWIDEHVAGEGKKSDLHYSDIALLFRSANAFSPYLDAFKSRGIPYLAEGEKYFYRTPEVVDFLNLISAIANPDDTLALVGVLRSPLGGLTDGEIFQLKQAKGLTPQQEPPLFSDKIGSLFRTLRELSLEARLKPVVDVIRDLFEKTWLLELTSQSTHGDQAIANLLKIQRLAVHWSSRGTMSLSDFIQRFQRYREDEREEGENPLADVKYDAVKVMTVHKAKGLEFPVVFLANLCAANRPSFEKPLLVRDWKANRVGLRLKKGKWTNSSMVDVEETIVKKEKAEEVRVFYVAMTRAKDQVMAVLNPEVKRGSRFASYLKTAGAWPREGETEFRIGESVIPVQPVVWDGSLSFEGRRTLIPSLHPRWDPLLLAGELKARSENFQLLMKRRTAASPTLDSREPEKGRFIDDEAGEGSFDPIQVGLLCHNVMEHWDFKTLPRSIGTSIEKQLTRSAQRLELVPKDPASALVLSEAKDILTGFFSSAAYDRLKRAEIFGREIPFLYPITSPRKDGAVLMRGVMDVLYMLDGQLVVGDYKTNRVGGSSLEKVAESYRAQGDAYRQAVKLTFKQDPIFELIFLREGKTQCVNN